MPIHQVMTAIEVAEELKISKQAVHRYIKGFSENGVPVFSPQDWRKTGKVYLINRSAVEKIKKERNK